MKSHNESAVLAAAAALGEARTLAPALHKVALRLSTEGVHVGVSNLLATASGHAIFGAEFAKEAARVLKRLEDVVAGGTSVAMEYVESGHDGESETYEPMPVRRRTAAASAAAEGIALIRSLTDRVDHARDLVEAAKAVSRMVAEQ